MKGKLSYHWIVVGGLFVVFAATIGISSNCYYCLIPYIMEEGYSASQTQFIALCTNVTLMLVGLLAARLIRRVGFVRLTVTGSIVMGVALAMRTFCYSYGSMLFWAVVQGAGYGCVMGVPTGLVLANWFHEKRGTATGIAATGSAAAGFLFVQWTNMAIPVFGWRMVNLAQGILAILLLVPVCLFILRETPEEKGLLPYGMTEEMARALEEDEGSAIRGISYGEFLKTRSFYWLCACMFLMMFANVGIGSNITLFMREDAGYDAAFAGCGSARLILAQAPGKILVGWVHDKFGIVVGSLYSLTLGAGFFLFLLLSGRPALAILCGIFMGMRNGMSSVLSPYLTALIVGRRDYARIYAVLNVVGTLGGSLGPVFAGAVFDRTGAFLPAFTVFAVMFAAVAAAAVLSVRSGQGFDEM